LTTKTDVAVIGGGPGGYTAAIRAAQLGLEVLLIEKDMLGGICTNVGCIPSKALIHAADVKHEAEKAGDIGVSAAVKLDFARTQKWKDGIVSDLRNGIGSLCKLYGVEVISGTAFFTSSNTLDVETEAGMRAIEYRKAIIATGTKIKEIPNIPVDHRNVINSDDVFALQDLPEKLIVVGGGYIAAEMACMFAKFGSKVVIVYRGDRLLKRMDPELGSALLSNMKALGIEVLFKSEIAKVEGNSAIVRNPDGEKRLEFDKLLESAGRVVALDNLGLEKTKVKLNEEWLVDIDSTCKTTDDDIYAVGDVTPGPQLAHKAFRQGKVAAEVIAGLKSAFDNVAMPMVVFSDPEIASVGMTEDEANGKGYKTVVGKMPFTALGKAKTLNRTDGFVKVVADGNGMLLGVHAIGPGAGDIIAEAALALEMAATLEDVAATIHAHPTMPEALAEAAEAALGKAIHIYKGKKK